MAPGPHVGRPLPGDAPHIARNSPLPALTQLLASPSDGGRLFLSYLLSPGVAARVPTTALAPRKGVELRLLNASRNVY